MEAGHVITTLFAMAVLIGVVTMVLSNPGQTNSLVSAGTTGITGLIHANEGV